MIILRSTDILKNWAREIFADFFAVRLFGPAALFSLCDLALFYYAETINKSFDKDHPSLKQRIRLMLEELNRWSKMTKGKTDRRVKNWKGYLPLAERTALKKYILSLQNRSKAPTDEHKTAFGQSDKETFYLRVLLM